MHAFRLNRTTGKPGEEFNLEVWWINRPTAKLILNYNIACKRACCAVLVEANPQKLIPAKLSGSANYGTTNSIFQPKGASIMHATCICTSLGQNSLPWRMSSR